MSGPAQLGLGGVPSPGDEPPLYRSPLTPVERHGGFDVKRDDLYMAAGAPGGKARTCYALMRGTDKGRIVIAAGSRSSPQALIVARIAAYLGHRCRVHTPSGKPGPEVQAAIEAGAEHVPHQPGYNSVIVKRAQEDAFLHQGVEIPFGMECWEAVRQTAAQVANIPEHVRRIVVPVGSGMSLAGVLTGLKAAGRDTPVLGVPVGADPQHRLERYAPRGWQEITDLREPGVGYGTAVEGRLGDLLLDPIYEAKALRFLEPGDLLWVVGIRPTLVPADATATLMRYAD